MLKREISGLGLLEVFITFSLVGMIVGVITVDSGDRGQFVIGAAIAVFALWSCHRLRRQRRRDARNESA
jgi:hypothetical protein